MLNVQAMVKAKGTVPPEVMVRLIMPLLQSSTQHCGCLESLGPSDLRRKPPPQKKTSS